MQQSPFAILLFISSRIEYALSLRGLGSTNSIPHAEDDHIVVPRTGEQADACASIIAIAGTRDPEFVEDLPKEEARNLKKKKRRNTYTEKEEFVCELSSTGDLIPLVGAEDQLDDLRQYLNNGDLVSGETTIEGLTLGENAFMADGNTSINSSIEALLPDGDLVLKPGSEVRRKLKNGQNGRRLATYEGFKQVLVVRVTDKDGLAHSDKADVMSDKVFGTNGDPENMKTQFNACSFGKLTITNTYTKNIDGYLAAPGVIEVKIGVSLKNSGKGTIRNAVTTAVQSKIKYNLPGNFDHVIYVLQKCYVDCGWAAYAYVNSWNSIFQGDYYKMPAVQLHEIG